MYRMGMSVYVVCSDDEQTAFPQNMWKIWQAIYFYHDRIDARRPQSDKCATAVVVE